MDNSSINILVVDDNEFNREVLMKRLSGEGYRVTTADNGELALGMLEVRSFDLVMLDLLMPKIDGYEVLRRMKAHPEWRHIPVIVVTAVDNLDSAAQCIKMGAEDYLTKPFNSILLLARVSSSLERSKIHEQASTTPRPDAGIDQNPGEARLAHYSTVFTLAQLGEKRDHFRRDHLKRLQAYCAILCQHLRLNADYAAELHKDFVEQLTAAVPLHNIGQICTPDGVIYKSDKLDKDERLILEKHPVDGTDALRLIKVHSDNQFIHVALEMVAHHHERWDGKGYPDHLSGEDIPLAARIITVIDVYEALTTQRPHRNAMPHDQAIEIIRQSKEKRFDPDIVDAFIACSEEINNISIQIPYLP